MEGMDDHKVMMKDKDGNIVLVPWSEARASFEAAGFKHATIKPAPSAVAGNASGDEALARELMDTYLNAPVSDTLLSFGYVARKARALIAQEGGTFVMGEPAVPNGAGFTTFSPPPHQLLVPESRVAEMRERCAKVCEAEHEAYAQAAQNARENSLDASAKECDLFAFEAERLARKIRAVPLGDAAQPARGGGAGT